MKTLAELFREATGDEPPGYLARIARDGLPDVARVPPGPGKSGLILAWLWRRLYGPDPGATPRRLIYALPPGSLTEPLAGAARGWLARLGLAQQVALHVAGGARWETQGDWREDMHRPAIVLGTADVLVSKALNRALDAGRALFPIDFALVTNGAQWVLDDPGLCPQAAETLRRLAGLAAACGTAEPFGLTCLSATPASLRAVRRLPADPGDDQAIAAAVLARHRPGTRTLVVLNTVDAAQRVYRQLRAGRRDCTLLHGRFRGIDRASRLAALFGEPPEPSGCIVVATQVAEAGLDLDAALVVTEAAPRPSLARRAGPAVLGRAALDRLFDTAPEPSGDDVDIAPYLLDAGDLDVQVAWATWTPGEDGAPDPEVRIPPVEYRCPVPLDDALALARDRAVWRFDWSAGRWTRIAGQPPSRPRPGELLLVSAADGGYEAETGFDPSAPGPVSDAPELLTPGELAERAADQDDAEPRRWQSLDQHSEQVRDQAAALLAALAPAISAEAALGAITAGYLHDLGKAHEIWQDAICAVASDDERSEVAAGRPWAKSGGNGSLSFAGGVAFRHELASLLLIDGPLAALLAQSPDPDLTRFLVLAHHGKLRVRVGDHPDPQPAEHEIHGLRHGAASPVPALLGQPATTLTVDLGPFLPGPDRSWTQTVRGLLDRYGPFVLGYLETVVRVADWRASGGRELPAADARPPRYGI